MSLQWLPRDDLRLAAGHRRSRSDSCRRARRASFAPIRSFELGVPESELSIPSRLSSRSASRPASGTPGTAYQIDERLTCARNLRPQNAPGH